VNCTGWKLPFRENQLETTRSERVTQKELRKKAERQTGSQNGGHDFADLAHRQSDGESRDPGPLEARRALNANSRPQMIPGAGCTGLERMCWSMGRTAEFHPRR
jgi:hypothetical protein